MMVSTGNKLLRRVLQTVLFSVVAMEAHAGLWISAYYAGWMQSYLPAQQVDFTAMTHIIHFAVVPRVDGTLDGDANAVTLANSKDIVARAHAAKVKVLISVGGENSADGFRGATTAANRPRFITNLVNFVTARGYDGVDLDWEPLDAPDGGPYSNLVNELRLALDAITPRPLLTAAVGSQPSLFASLQSRFDQINLMTYSFSGAWPGWVTWFHAPIYDGGYRFASRASWCHPPTESLAIFWRMVWLPANLGSGFPSTVVFGAEATARPPAARRCRANPGRQHRRWPRSPTRRSCPTTISRNCISGIRTRSRLISVSTVWGLPMTSSFPTTIRQPAAPKLRTPN